MLVLRNNEIHGNAIFLKKILCNDSFGVVHDSSSSPPDAVVVQTLFVISHFEQAHNLMEWKLLDIVIAIYVSHIETPTPCLLFVPIRLTKLPC